MENHPIGVKLNLKIDKLEKGEKRIPVIVKPVTLWLTLGQTDTLDNNPLMFLWITVYFMIVNAGEMQPGYSKQ